MPQSWEGWGEVGCGGGCVGPWGTSLPLILFTLSAITLDARLFGQGGGDL